MLSTLYIPNTAIIPNKLNILNVTNILNIPNAPNIPNVLDIHKHTKIPYNPNTPIINCFRKKPTVPKISQ